MISVELLGSALEDKKWPNIWLAEMWRLHVVILQQTSKLCNLDMKELKIKYILYSFMLCVHFALPFCFNLYTQAVLIYHE